VVERAGKTVRLRTVLTILLVVAIVVTWLALWQWHAIRRAVGGPAAAEAGAAPPPVDAGAADAAISEPKPTPAEAAWADALGAPPRWPGELDQPIDCESAEAELARVCRALDAAAPFDEVSTPGGSCAVLRDAAEALARRPPDVASELASYPTLLANAFHLFRVVGRERMSLLRRALDTRPELIEPAALAGYRWALTRADCARSGSTPIRLEPMYDYAVFLFRTLGGQAYLRRRDPAVEALASFYALLIVDRADREGANPLGVDPRRDVERTRRLIAGSDLVFRDRYLDALDGVAARWAGRGTPR